MSVARAVGYLKVQYAEENSKTGGDILRTTIIPLFF
jgi:hypothetical protein